MCEDNPKCYTVFVHNWWRMENGKRVPGAGRKTTLAKRLTYAEAQRTAQEYNRTHEPGPLSRKAEFTS